MYAMSSQPARRSAVGHITVSASLLLLWLLGPPTMPTAAQGQSAPLQRSAAVYLPIVGSFERAQLAAPTDRPWAYLGETNRVHDVAVDRRTGTVWAATEGGLVRRDPTGGGQARLSLQAVRFVAVDGAGAVWVGGFSDDEGRLSRLATDGSWRHYTEADGLATGRLRDLVADPGGPVWAAYSSTSWQGTVPQNGGLTRLSVDGTVRSFGLADGWPSQSIVSIAPNPAGGVWFGYGDPGIELLPSGIGQITAGGTVRFESAADGLPNGYLLVQAVGADGAVYAVAATEGPRRIEAGIYRRRPAGRWALVDLPAGAGFSPEMIKWVAIDLQGALWIVPDYVGYVLRLRPDGSSQRLPGEPARDDETLRSVEFTLLTCNSLAFGTDGSLWFASEAGEDGLLQLDRAESWHFHHDRDGSAPNHTRLIAVDGQGDAWLASDGEGGQGLYRYGLADEPGWHHESGASSVGRSLAVDRAGNVWAAEQQARVWRRSADGRRRTTFSAAEGVPAAEVRTIAVSPGGTVWLGTAGGGVSRLGPDERWVTLTISDGLASNSVLSIAFDDHGGTWFGASRVRRVLPAGQGIMRQPGGVSYLDSSGRLSTFTDPRLATEFLTKLAVDGAGNLWVGTSVGLLRRGADGQWATIELPAAATPAPVRALAFDAAGNLWISREGGVLLRRAPDGTWRIWNGPTIRDILVDPAGDVWLAADVDELPSATGEPGGLRRIAPDGRWTIYQLPVEPEVNLAAEYRGVVALARDESGRILCATRGDQHKRLEADGSFSTFVMNDQLPSDEVNDLATDGAGTLWAATAEGLAGWSPATGWRTIHTADGLPTGGIAAVTTDRQGAVWAGTDPAWVADTTTWRSTGVVRLDADGAVIERVQLPAESAGTGVHAMAWTLDGGLWLATHTMVDPYGTGDWARHGSGVSRREPDGRWLQLGVGQGLPSDEVRAIAVDGHGDSWFATDAGLAQRSTNGRWTLHSTANGLLGNDVHALAVDRAGRLLLATDAGVQQRSDSGGWRTWTTVDGLSDIVVLDLAFAADGRVWLATGAGGVTVMPPVDW
jgi:ligand-binding sensor domain-containing protein